MKKNLTKYIIALVFTPMLLLSCSEDFLNESDPNNQTSDTFGLMKLIFLEVFQLFIIRYVA